MVSYYSVKHTDSARNNESSQSDRCLGSKPKLIGLYPSGDVSKTCSNIICKYLDDAKIRVNFHVSSFFKLAGLADLLFWRVNSMPLFAVFSDSREITVTVFHPKSRSKPGVATAPGRLEISYYEREARRRNRQLRDELRSAEPEEILELTAQRGHRWESWRQI